MNRKDLRLPYRAVMAGHAVAEYMLHNQDWKNEYLIYLDVENESSLKDWVNLLKDKGIKPFEFREPDIDNQLVSIAVLGNRELFSNLKLMGAE